VVASACGCGLESYAKPMSSWKSRFKFAFGRNKKGEIFRIHSYLEKTDKSNDVHAQKFLGVRKDLLLPLKIRVTGDCDIMVIH